MPLKNWCSIHVRWSKSSLKHSMAFFPSLKLNFIAYRSSSRPDCIFEIHQLWQSGFSRVYSNCCCSCSFEPEIIKISQSSHKTYNNNILNFQESSTILNVHKKKCLETYRMHPVPYAFKNAMGSRTEYMRFLEIIIKLLFLAIIFLKIVLPSRYDFGNGFVLHLIHV